MEEADARVAAIEAFWRACGVTVRLEETPQDRFADSAFIPAVRSVARARQIAADARSDLLPAAEAFGGDVGDGGEALERRSERPPAAAPPAGRVRSDDRATWPTGDAAAPAVGDEAQDDTVNAARELARTATTLEALHAALRAFEGCPLKLTAQTTCVGEGPADAALMVVGEAPGKDEDEVGRPFVGRSGKLLEKMLAAIGLSRAEVYITNVIPWRPPGNRTPSPIETATCEVFVRREIALVRPRVLLLLGGAAAKTLLRVDAGIMSQRGKWQAFPLDDDDRGEGNRRVTLDAVATFHPAYLLRTPAEKRRAWQDLIAVRQRLDALR